MAHAAKRLSRNLTGEFFVDSTCINCDTCRQLAPETFEEAGDSSYVYRQPLGVEPRRNAFRALVACPTGSIGAASPAEARAAAAEFPLELEDGVFYCGFNSGKSYGGNSYFVRHEQGNWLVDSPRYVERLARRLDELGGVRHIFLTHRDDVADAEKWSRRFGSRRIIHKLERASQPEAEFVMEGFEPVRLGEEFLAIPTPGHTRGHCVLLYRHRYLFSGDHLWWSRELRRLNASRRVCWHSWPRQVESMEKLSGYPFEWVLPGHGERIKLQWEEMGRQVRQLAGLMKKAP
jgi:glyoxylase-like metal-dependent hydrolase (beta-lactamase superfamily II)/ferredoxin